MKANDVIKLTAVKNKRSTEMTVRVFGRLLHMSCAQGWVPDGIRRCWPRGNWDTELVLRDLNENLGGSISEYDADGLHRALKRLLAVDGLSFDTDLYLAARSFLDVVGKNAFTVAMVSQGERCPFSRLDSFASAKGGAPTGEQNASCVGLESATGAAEHPPA